MYKKSEKRHEAGLGNTNGVILKDPDVRQSAYDDYCSHLAKGKSKKSWFYNKDGYRCSWETMEKYIKDEVEFDALKKIEAECKGFGTWEEVVEQAAIGKNRHANTATLQMLMRNKFGWDKITKEEQDGQMVDSFNAV